MMETRDETSDMNEASQMMRRLGAGSIRITESMVVHWVDAAEIEDHYRKVQNIVAPISNGPTQG
jgi:hypothetical protein